LVRGLLQKGGTVDLMFALKHRESLFSAEIFVWHGIILSESVQKEETFK